MGRLQELVKLGHRALQGGDFAVLAQEAVTVAQRALDVDECDLVFLSADGTARLVAACDRGQCRAEALPLQVAADSPIDVVLRSRAPVVIDDFSAPGAAAKPPHVPGVVSGLHVPLLSPERVMGVLSAHTHALRHFADDDVEQLQLTAHLVAAGLQRGEPGERDRRIRRAEQMMAIGQVAAGVAHELRNPLTSIKGLVQVNMREAQARGLPADDLAVIDHEIRRMERTLQTFLDFARPPKPDRKPIDLRLVLDRVFALISGRAKKQNVAVRCSGPSFVVCADEDQLQQLFLNLTLNSLDVMPEGGTIEVEISPSPNDFVEVVLRDTGPGIPPHILPKVFQTFVSSKETGVGLGLPVSLRIAEDHGGTLNAYNLPSGGACFVLRLPRK